MSVLRSRLVLVCQQAIAFAVVLAVAASAASVVSLEIVTPAPRAGHAGTRLGAAEGVPVADGPVRPTVREVPLDGIDRRGLRALEGESSQVVASAGARTGTPLGTLSALSAPEPVHGYATVGVTWAGSDRAWDAADLDLEVRTSSGGVWSTWQPMHLDPEHEADPEETRSEGRRAQRGGTDPVVVGDVDDVQVRVTTPGGETPDRMSLSLVNPGGPDRGDPAAMTVAAEGAPEAAGLAATSVPQPTIYTRRQWRADERLRDPSSLRYGTIKAGFVHHTVNANGYTRAQVPAIIRGIYAYHTRSRGWSDIGYNFLVDRFGRIWEGRYGGIRRPVVGAHTLGYNDYSFAMSAIGNFETARPTAAMIDAYAWLFAWKLSLHGVSATATRQRLGSRYFKAISGHRDAGSTACPGRYLYARLPGIRTLAARYQRMGLRAVVPRPRNDLTGSAWPDLVVRDARTKKVRIVQTGGQLRFAPRRAAAGGLGGADRVVAAGDLTGDRRPDLLVRTASSGATRTWRGTGAGTFVRTVAVTTRLAGLDRLAGVGDWNGDGRDDVVGRGRSSGALYLYPGHDDGTLGRARLLAKGFAGYDRITGAGDFDGDGRPDLVVRGGARLYLVPGRPTGVGKRVALPGRWSGFDLVAGRGDATRDGEPDLVARARRSGDTYVFPGTGTGGLQHWVGPFERFRGYRSLALAPVAGGGGADVVAWGTRGRVSVVANNNARNVVAVVDTGLTLPGADLLLGVGDWNRDGRGDLLTRSAKTGAVYLRAGAGGNRFAAPVRMATGWGAVSQVTPVGDVTGDGRPDLVGRQAGRLRVYPGNGSAGFGPSFAIASAGWVSSRPQAAAGMTWVRGLGDLDGDGRAQDLLLRTPAGHLWFLPAAASGYARPRYVAPGFARYDLAG